MKLIPNPSNAYASNLDSLLTTIRPPTHDASILVPAIIQSPKHTARLDGIRRVIIPSEPLVQDNLKYLVEVCVHVHTELVGICLEYGGWKHVMMESTIGLDVTNTPALHAPYHLLDHSDESVFLSHVTPCKTRRRWIRKCLMLQLR